MIKAYIVRDREGYSDYPVAVFAESRGKAIYEVLGTDEYPKCDWSFTELKAIRAPKLDKIYRGNSRIDWDNMEDRVALVKECGWHCDSEWIELCDCENCDAKEWCETYAEVQDENRANY